MSRKVLAHLKPTAYEHPSDRNALDSLERMPGIAPLLKKVNEEGIDRVLRLQCLGSAIRVSAKNFPDLHGPFQEACTLLGLFQQPDLYLLRGAGHIQTFTYGVDQPIVMINLEGKERLSADELVYLFGHELAHIKSQHLLYYQTALVLPTLKHLLSTTTFGLGGLATSGIELALYNWLMMAKCTADRAGLLTCQSVEVALSTLLKLSGLTADLINDVVLTEFKQQAEEFSLPSDRRLDHLAKTVSFVEHQFPWSVLRASELLKWVESGAYDQILNDPGPSALDPSNHWGFLTSW
ncbi:M48 family metallopeptidase [Lyngbya confervoides]|uniref:M48 family metallopeptidase n=1 Tax=Lyngbya confervoides BDU141951 TaxID=1574623 RepID=A0ABD4T7L7_9CYAN|nr:M48 family metallopeptidase [Lyngbya confervoides]MCM1984282.1 M48 family metallopeptidase [Lyngbya confervoides BDU141951]